jgi:hypothetical protein
MSNKRWGSEDILGYIASSHPHMHIIVAVLGRQALSVFMILLSELNAVLLVHCLQKSNVRCDIRCSALS